MNLIKAEMNKRDRIIKSGVFEPTNFLVKKI